MCTKRFFSLLFVAVVIVLTAAMVFVDNVSAEITYLGPEKSVSPSSVLLPDLTGSSFEGSQLQSPYGDWQLANSFIDDNKVLSSVLETGTGLLLIAQQQSVPSRFALYISVECKSQANAVSFAVGALGASMDGNMGMNIVPTAENFQQWKSLEIVIFPKEGSVYPFVQMASSASGPVDSGIGQMRNLSIKLVPVSQIAGTTPPPPTPTPTPTQIIPTPTPTPIVSTPTPVQTQDYVLQGSTLIIYSWRSKLQQYTAEGSPEVLGDSIGWNAGNRLVAMEVGNDLRIDLPTLNLEEGTNRFNVRVSQNNWLYSGNFNTTVSNVLWHVTTSGYGTGDMTMVIRRTGNVYSFVPVGTLVPTKG